MRKIRRTLLLIALALLLFSLAAVAVSAKTEETSTPPTVAIKSFALNLGDSVYIKVSAAGENLPEGSKIQILVWDTPQSDYTIKSENTPYILNQNSIDPNNGRSVFYFTKITATDMTKNFYFVACVKSGNEYIYSSVQKYSVLQYAYNKRNTTDISLKNLLSAMLEYGAMSQIYLGIATDRLANDTYYKVSVSSGLFEDGMRSGLYLSSDKPIITAKEAERGYEFIGWANSAGYIVSTSAVYTIPSISAEETYTATYEALERIEPTADEYFDFVLLDDGTYAIGAKSGVTLPADLVIPAYHADAKVTAIVDGAFAAHTEIRRVRFEYTNSLTAIGNGAFAGCYDLLSFTVPSTVTNIGDLAFGGCYRLVEVFNRSALPLAAGSIENGGVAAFALDIYTAKNSESKLAMLSNDLIVRSDDFTVAIVAFNSTASSLALPDEINGMALTINAYAFAGNKTLKVLDIGSGLTAIGDYAFKDATTLNRIISSDADALSHIGKGAFEGCVDLTSFYITESVTTIGADAFGGCVSLTIFTPISAPAIGWSEGWNSYGCPVVWSYTASNTDTPIVPGKS